jgi:uncharacterized RDD family membrane protein YckC
MSGGPEIGDRLETPERVDLEVHYASVGSRVLAQVIDMLLVALGWAIVAISLGLVTPLGSWRIVLIFAVSFLLFWFYFAVFEIAWHGQTPGKRIMHIRVQKMGGFPIGWTESLLRNLLRPVDALVGYAVGLATMLMTSRSQRVGDLVAGTVVVHEAAGGVIELAKIGYATPGVRAAGAPDLKTREYEVLHEFLARRAGLDPASAERIEGSLADVLRRRLIQRGIMHSRWENLSDAAFLVRLDADYRGEKLWIGAGEVETEPNRGS